MGSDEDDEQLYPKHWPTNVPANGYIKIPAQQKDSDDIKNQLEKEIKGIKIVTIEEICNIHLYNRYKL